MKLHIAKRDGYTIYRPREGGNIKRFIRVSDNTKDYMVFEYPHTGPQIAKGLWCFKTLDEAIQNIR